MLSFVVFVQAILRQHLRRACSAPNSHSRPVPATDRKLTPPESALARNASVTPLGSALTVSLDLKPFRIRTYRKRWGEGALRLTGTILTASHDAGEREKASHREFHADPNCPSVGCLLHKNPHHTLGNVYTGLARVPIALDVSNEFCSRGSSDRRLHQHGTSRG